MTVVCLKTYALIHQTPDEVDTQTTQSNGLKVLFIGQTFNTEL